MIRILGVLCVFFYTKNTSSDVVFFTLFPNLHPFLLDVLRKAGKGCLYTPSLYPTLLILARLHPDLLAADNPAISLSPFVPEIERLLASGVLKTRSLAAEALSSILPRVELNDFVGARIQLLEKSMKQNQVHGIILLVNHSLRKISDGEQIIEEMIRKSWLITSNPCPFTASLYIETLEKAISSNPAASNSTYLAHIIDQAMDCSKSNANQGPLTVLKTSCISFIVSLRSVRRTAELLGCGDRVVAEAVFATPGLGDWFQVKEGMGEEEGELTLDLCLHLTKVG